MHTSSLYTLLIHRTTSSSYLKKSYELVVERKVLTLSIRVVLVNYYSYALRYPFRVTRNTIKNVSGNAKNTYQSNMNE